MALVPEQSLVTVSAKGIDLAGATDRLRIELDRYPQARIVSLTHQSNYWSGWSGKTTLVAVVEHDPIPGGGAAGTTRPSA